MDGCVGSMGRIEKKLAVVKDGGLVGEGGVVFLVGRGVSLRLGALFHPPPRALAKLGLEISIFIEGSTPSFECHSYLTMGDSCQIRNDS